MLTQVRLDVQPRRARDLWLVGRAFVDGGNCQGEVGLPRHPGVIRPRQCRTTPRLQGQIRKAPCPLKDNKNNRGHRDGTLLHHENRQEY